MLAPFESDVMSSELRILIVGGYGIFGARLVDLLEHEPRLTLLVAGRSFARAQVACQARGKANAQVEPVEFDRSQHGAAQLSAMRPHVVVDASGPFQAYGGQAYRLIEACIAAGVHYLDLADGSEFVNGVARMDEAAKAAKVWALAGASSFPVLTAAVVRRLAQGMLTVESIQGGIAPSPYAGVGLNVIRAIASYAGQPIQRQRGGALQLGHPFTEHRRFVINVPGRMPLRSTLFSLVDVPDLRALAEQWPGVRSVWMGAGPVPIALHRTLIACAWLVRWRLLPGLSWLAPLMHGVANRVRWGEHRGGMFVQVNGRGVDGQAMAREWHLLAEGNDGPLIPCMAAAALVHKLLAGHAVAPGARAAIGELELPDYEALFAVRTIYTAVRQTTPTVPAPLFRSLLGDAFERLPRAVQWAHSVPPGVLSAVAPTQQLHGRCTVRRGRHPLAWLMARLIGFPRAQDDQPITVDMTAHLGGERWLRRMGEQSFSSVQALATGRSQGLLRERFGPMAVDMALVADEHSLRYVVRGWSLFGLAMPRWLGPRSTAVESAAGNRFVFDVEIRHPLAGLIAHYSGWLHEPAALTPAQFP